MSPGPEQRYKALSSRYAHAARLLDAAVLLSPENLADWLDHLDTVFDNIDTRLGYIEKRLDAAGIPPLPDGVPDGEVLSYFAMYAVNPVTGPEITDTPMERQNRLAAFGGSGEETSS